MRMHRKSSGADETLWLHCARVEGNFDIIEDTQAATKWLQQLGMARSDRKMGREPELEWTPDAISRDRSKTERLGSISRLARLWTALWPIFRTDVHFSVHCIIRPRTAG